MARTARTIYTRDLRDGEELRLRIRKRRGKRELVVTAVVVVQADIDKTPITADTKANR